MTFERKRSCMSFLVEGRSKSIFTVASVVEWLRRRAYGQHGLGTKPTRAVLLYPWERHFTTFSPAWWSRQAALKLQVNSNILVSPEASRGNCLPYVLAPSSLSCKSGE